MKAAVLNAPTGRFDIEEIEIGTPRDREVLVAIKASGLCHSDLHIANMDFGLQLPAVLGHELAGVVEQIGPAVTEFSVGDHVVAALIASCGTCEACRAGRTYQCYHPERTQRDPADPPKLSRDGKPVSAVFGTAGFAEYALVHENQLAKVPQELPFAQASLLGCGIITGIGAVRNAAQVKPGETVVAIGAGGVGLNVIAGARMAGAGTIIAIDTQPAKEPLARRFGATHFINAAAGDPVAAVHDLLPYGVDHAFEVVGNKAVAAQAIAMVRKGGTVYIVGMYEPGVQLSLEVLADLIRRQIGVRGVYMGSSNLKEEVPRLAAAYLAGDLNVDDLISREIDLGEINDAYEELAGGAIARSVITSFDGRSRAEGHVHA